MGLSSLVSLPLCSLTQVLLHWAPAFPQGPRHQPRDSPDRLAAGFIPRLLLLDREGTRRIVNQKQLVHFLEVNGLRYLMAQIWFPTGQATS